MALRLSQSQKTSQKQIQKLSQIQIQSLKYLAMNSADLVNEIYNEIEKNPVLEISEEDFSKGIESLNESEKKYLRDSSNYNDYNQDETISFNSQEKSDAFQSFIENKADVKEFLAEHLLKQFELLDLPENQMILGKKLIYNLNQKGYHILAPVSFLNYDVDKDEDLQKVMNIIQNLEPCGCCCQNVSESLLIQAKAFGNASELTIFLLSDHLDFLVSLQSSKILKRIHEFLKEESEKSFSKENFAFLESITEEDIEESISFIKKLNPYPASEYTPDDNSFVIPEVSVKKVQLKKNDLVLKSDLEADGIIFDENKDFTFVVRSLNGILPEVTISKEYTELVKEKIMNNSQQEKIEKMIQEGKNFIESLRYRENSVFKAASAIVKIQFEFFEKGPGHLVPLRQKDLAEILEVHETTISRIAASKYLECEWGIFPFKYFFVNAVSEQNLSDDGEVVSKDKILFQIKKILEAQPKDGKKLSDQKLADMLLEKGVKVARRTVAKYRSQIGVGSSYER